MASKEPEKRAKKTAERTAKKAVKQAAKKHPGAVIAIVVILVILIAVGVVLYLKVDAVQQMINGIINPPSETATVDDGGSGNLSGTGDGGTSSETATVEDGGTSSETATVDDGDTSSGADAPPKATTYGDKDLSFHFLELGNNYTGDSTYIKAGDVDILIDAGSRQNSAATIASEVDKYCTDGTLEFVIATHAHQDHIAGFTNTKTNDGIFKRYECEVIIDFALTNATSATYNNYVTAREAEVALGAKHYTALDCVKGLNGAQQTYELGEGMSMTILYQKFYENTSGDENNYSVCVLFNHGDNYYLLTGDLEADGEASLVENNDLPEVQLFKAGHHGSYTATTDALLSVIKPKIVCVCCCAGAVEYTQNSANTFPSQAFIDRVAPYTARVYVTTVGTVTYNEEKGKYEDVGFASMNGNITVLSSGGKVTVRCSDNDTLLKDTEWFAANRTRPPAWAA